MFVEGAKHIGATLGMSTFAIGVLIVGFGTSFPELASSLAAVLQNSPDKPTLELVVANAVGSNITNILLVVGLAVIIGGKILIKRDLIKTGLPIFFIATAHFLLMIHDGQIDRVEAVLLVATFAAYVWYLFSEAEHEDNIDLVKTGRRPRLQAKYLAYLVLGLGAVSGGAYYAIQMVINLGSAWAIPSEIISIFAIAIGTSLPELSVALKSLRDGQGEMAIGSIFGSNAFNILMVVGIPGLFVSALPVTGVVMVIGVPILIAASAIFFVNGLAKQIMRWEGAMLLLFFAFFVIKLIEVTVS